jgi:NitT/TauT family transport system substrate-binding protein
MKTKMSKLTKMAVLLLAMSAVLAGCSTKKQETQQSTTAESTQAAVQETSQAASEEQTTQNQTIHIASLKGPTSIGMVRMMDENDGTYEFDIYATANEISPLLISGSVDIANIPANLAAVLYAKTQGQIEVLNINTLGVLYLVGAQEVESFEDIKGKTIYSTGKGTTPEYALDYLLAANGISVEDVTIEFKSEAVEVVAALAADKEAFGVLPQPYATSALLQNEDLKLLLDFSEEWRRVSADSELVTGVTVVRKEFLENNRQLVEDFMADLENSIQYVNEHVEEMSTSVEKYDIIKAAVAQKAIPYCNLSYIDGTEMKTKLSGYLSVLEQQDAASVGGTLPGDDFYYQED